MPVKPLADRLRDLEPRLRQICEIVGIPGCSIGVMHQGEEVCKNNMGYTDIEAKLPPRSDTLCNVASLTKAIVAAAFGCLVAEGKVEWSTPVKEIIPEFGREGDAVDDLITPLDLLSMRTGHTQLRSMSWQGQAHVLLKKSDVIKSWNATPRTQGFRDSFIYNNWSYSVAVHIIEHLTGQPFHKYLEHKLFSPLGLRRTKMMDFTKEDNSAVPYAVLDDMSYVAIAEPADGVGTFTEGSSGLMTTIDDMLVLYSAFTAAIKDQFERKTNTTPGNPFKYCTMLVSGHNVRLNTNKQLREQSYGCGWVRAQLPGPFGMVSFNPNFVDTPNVLEGSESRLCLYHQGRRPGCTSNLALLPEADTIIALLANACPQGDGLDWMSQMIIEEIFDAPIRQDYEQIAREAAIKVRDHIPSMARQLEDKRILGTKPSLDLQAYVGKYYHDGTNFWVEIGLRGHMLSLTFTDSRSDVYDLRHYHHNTFIWLVSFNEAARRARHVEAFDAEDFLFHFDVSDGSVDQIKWHVVQDTGPVPYILRRR